MMMMNKLGGIFAVVATSLALISLIYFAPDMYEHFAVRYTNADRQAFKNTATYNEGMLDDLAKYKYEYDTSNDDVERAAIADLVRSRFANFDKSKIENYELVKFLEDCGV